MSSPAIQFRLLDRDLFSPHTYYCVGFLRPIDSTGLKPFTNGLYVPVCGHLIVSSLSIPAMEASLCR